MNASAPVRYHALDALRAFALLLGVVFHAALCFTAPAGIWAVGTPSPEKAAAVFVFYVHAFRMEAFFLLAGFFARLVVERRGVLAFARDRAMRIGLVFLVALYPMKVLLAAVWIAGGKATGWLTLPRDVADLPVWRLALGAQALERWPNINLTHLWFLYYLACITACVLGLRALVLPLTRGWSSGGASVDRAFRRFIGGGWGPWGLAVLVVPLVLRMKGGSVDTPDRGFAWHLPVMGLYTLFFVLGWLLQRQPDLVAAFGRRWPALLPASLVLGLLSLWASGLPGSADTWAGAHQRLLRLGVASGTSLTMCLAVPGWLGLFVSCFDRSREWIRYLADSSYWIYLSHLPVVVALQVALVSWGAPWWAKWALINLIAAALLFPSYHWLVRRTWMGRWLNGRRAPVAAS